MKSRLSLWLWAVLYFAVEIYSVLSPPCVYPFTELPYNSLSYCAKCDTTCLTCSGTAINSCSSCPTDFTLDPSTGICTAPASSTISTVVSQYHTYGFEKEAQWKGGDATSWSQCGIITVLHSAAGTIYTTHSSLSIHYQVRVMASLWWFSGTTNAVSVSLYNAANVVNTISTALLASGPNASPTGDAGTIANAGLNPYCANSKATNYDQKITDSATNIQVQFYSASASWGVREYVFIQYLCSQPDCASCYGPLSTQCYTCNDPTKQVYTGAQTYGTCQCKTSTGYYAYPTGNSTYYCVNQCPNFLATGQYYGDNVTKTCVLTCPAVTGAPVFGLSFASDIYGVCVQTCDPTITLGGVPYPLYYDLVNKKCTTACPSAQPYSFPVNRACYSACPADSSGNQYYIYFNTMQCVLVCPNITQGTEVVTNLFIDNTTNSCVTECDNSRGYYGYIHPTTGKMQCILNCPTNYFTDLSSGQPLCTIKCPYPSWFGDYKTLPPACVQTCSFGTYGDNSTDRYCVTKCNSSYYGLTTGTRQCVKSCPTGTWGQPTTMSCVIYPYQCMNVTTNPFSSPQAYLGFSFDISIFSFADSQTNLCVTANNPCSAGQFKYNVTYMCVATCPFGTYSNNITQWCVDKCYADYFADNTTNQCVLICSPGLYADRGATGGNKCVYNCNQTGGYPYRDDNVRQCVAICTSGYADPIAQSCVYNCTAPLYLNNSNTSELTCVYSCVSPYFAYNNSDSGICVLTCPSQPPLFGDVVNGQRVCVQVCSVGKFGDQVSGSFRWCVANCQNNTFAQSDTLRRCVTKCNTTTYGRSTDWTCVLPVDCPTDYVGDPTTNLCVNQCPLANGTTADNVSKLCVEKCPITSNNTYYYYADSHSGWCIPTCNAAYNEFGNNSTQTCVPQCLDRNAFADSVSSRRYCIALCAWNGAVKYYRNNQTGVCVVSTGCTGTYNISSSATYTQKYFADNYTLYCVQRCPNVSGVPSWGYAPTLTCVALCFGSTWGDNSTGYPLCVPLCSTYPTPLWSYDGPAKSIMLCVNPCPAPYFGQDYFRTCVTDCPPAVNGSHAQTFAYSGTRRCVLQCPAGTWSDYLTGVCFHYPINCTAPCWYSNSSCTTYRWADDYNTSCVYLCNASPYNTFGDNLTQTCTGRCSALSYADNYTGTRICVARCPGTYDIQGVVNGPYDSYGDNYTQGCVLRCQQPNTYADWQLSLCLGRCMGDNPAMIPTYANLFTMRCVIALFCPTTPDLYYGQNNTRACQPACPLTGSYVTFADNITRTCIPQCSNYTNSSSGANYTFNSTSNFTTRFYGNTASNRPMCVIACAIVPRQFGQNDTNRCVALCPDNQYGDQTGNRSCVPVCPNILGVTWFSQLTNRICVLVCENGTWGNYYNYIGPKCETVGTDCNITYFGDNSTHMCVPVCPVSMNYFGDPQSRLCTTYCPYLNASTLLLVNTTAGINLTEGRLFADASTRLCVYTCPVNYGPQGTFGDNTTNTCVAMCPLGTFGDANTVNRFCVTTCTGGSFADTLTTLCVQVCPASPPTFGQQVNWTCVATCPSGLWADSSTRRCVSTCSNNTFRLTLTTSLCTSVCPSNPDLYGDTLTYNCVATCSAGQYADPMTRLCVSSCNISTLLTYNYRCVKLCPNGLYGNSSNYCVLPTSCQNNTYGDNLTTWCVSTCPAGSYADPISRYCIAICPTGTYGDNLQCVSTCQTNGTVASNFTKVCASLCPNYTYAYQGQCYSSCSGITYQNDDTRLCDTSCPANLWADPTTNRCVRYCPTGYYRQLAGTQAGFCVLASNGCNPYFSDFISGNCTSLCSNGYWGYIGNYTCNSTCPPGLGLYGYASTASPFQRTCYAPLSLPGSAPTLFGDSISGQFLSVCPTTPNITFGDVNRQLCVSVCQPFGGTAYYGDPSTQRCQSVCQQPSIYTADPITKLCTFKCTYGTFRYNITPICMTNCLAGYGDFTSRMCVATCALATGTFGYANGTSGYRVCLALCPATFYSENVTRTCTQSCPNSPVWYFAENTTQQCVTSCRYSFADKSNGICMNYCWSNTYPNADNSTNTCVYTCPEDPDYYADSHVCVKYCTTANYYADSTNRICTSRCSNATNYTQYGDPRTGRCVKNCSEGYWGDNSTNLCVKTCPPNSFAENTTGKCVAECPIQQYTYADPLLHVCAPTCSGGLFGSQVNQTCIPVCDMDYYGDPTTTLCTLFCPVKIYSYGQNVTRTCVTSCKGYVGAGGVIGYADNYSRLCRQGCQNTLPIWTFADPTTQTCVPICPNTYYARNNTDFCVQNCPTNSYADNFSRYCVSQCPDNPESYGDTTQNICIYSCLRGQFSDNTTNLCVGTCPGPTPVDYFGDKFTGRCVYWCTQGTYAQNTSRLCVATCPSPSFADNLTRRCVSDCPPSEWTFADQSSHSCVRICPPGTFAENTTQACQSACWNYSLTNQSYADNISNFCVAQCPFDYFGDNTTHKCVLNCTGTPNLYGHYIGRVCVAELDCYPDNATGSIYYADRTTLTCVQKCPLSLWADTHIFVCVPTCNATLPEYRSNSNQTCVWPCPSDPDEYADSLSGNCVRRCPTNYYAWTGNHTCHSSCVSFGLFADSTTNRCVSACATMPYLYADPLLYVCALSCSGGYFADNMTQTCVPTCPLAWETFGQLTNHTCVSLCPGNTYADPLNGRTCQTTCTNNTFADSYTSTCVQHCSSIRPYWFEDTSLGYGVCVAVCPGESYAHLPTQVCKYLSGSTSTCPSSYFADRSSRHCVLFCPSGTFSFATTKYCEYSCSGIYYADPILRQCVTTCSANLYQHTLNASSNVCVQYCPYPRYSMNASTGVAAACVPTCTGMLALPTTRTCETYCPLPYFGDWNNSICVTNCTPNYAYNPNRTCLEQCAYPYYGNPYTYTCDLLCPNGLYGQNITRMCKSGCPNDSYADPSTYLCVADCPSWPSLYADPRYNRCLPSCIPPLFAFDLTRLCVGSCPNITNGSTVFQYLADMTPGIQRCVLQCNNALLSFADFTNNICTNKCPAGFYANNYTKQCVTNCTSIPKPTFSDNTSRICMAVCLSGSYGYETTLNCVAACWWPYFADDDTSTCVQYCPTGSFAVNATAKCQATCPANSYADPVTHRCLAQCPALQLYFNYAGNWTCLLSCPSTFFAATDNQSCISICNTSSGLYAYPVTNLCVKQCPAPYRGYAPNNTCVLSCPAQNYFYDNTINVCALCDSRCLICVSLSGCTQCNPGYNLFNGYCSISCIPTNNLITYANAAGQCVAVCPPGTFGSNQSYACVTICPVQQYGDPTLRLCTLCPPGCTACTSANNCSACQVSATLAIDNLCYSNCNSTYKYSYNGTCYNTCPPGTYLTYTNVLCAACAALCQTCQFSPTNCNSCATNFYLNNTCLTTCPPSYFGNSTTHSCQPCSSAPANACSSPLTYSTSYSFQNYQPVITLQFNQNVSLTSQLQDILKINLRTRRLLTVGTLINNGVPYTYEILSNGTIKIYLQVGTSLVSPTFSIDISNPAAVISSATGLSLQSVQSLLTVAKIDYYPPSDGLEAPTNFVATFVVVAVLLLYMFSFLFSDVMVRPLQMLQLLFLHCMINSPVPANFYYLLIGLQNSSLVFLNSWFANAFPKPSPYYTVPIPIASTCIDYIFLRNVGQIFILILVFGCLWLLFLMLGNKRVVSHKIWHSFLSEVSQKRYQLMAVNDVLSLLYLPVAYFAFLQLQMLFGSGIYAFNAASTVIFLALALLLPVAWTVAWCKRSPEDISNSYWFLTLRVRVPNSVAASVHDDRSQEQLQQISERSAPVTPSAERNPYQLQSVVFYGYMLLCALWMTALYAMIIPQIALLITTNGLFLLYLLKARPYINKINLLFTILFLLACIALESYQIYFFRTDATTYASNKTAIGHPFVVALCVVLVLLLLWALWRVVWEVNYLVRNFKRTLLYLQFADHDYVGEVEASEKYSEYDKLVQKVEAGVGDLVIDRIREEVRPDGEKVIKVTKKRMVKKSKVQGRKKGEAIPEAESLLNKDLQFVRINPINLFDYQQFEEPEPAPAPTPTPALEPTPKPKSPIRNKRDIDDDIRDFESNVSEQFNLALYREEEEEKKIDVEPGQTLIRNIQQLSQIQDAVLSSDKGSQHPFSYLQREGLSEEQKKNQDYPSDIDMAVYQIQQPLPEAKFNQSPRQQPEQPENIPDYNQQENNYQEMKSESVIEPVQQQQPEQANIQRPQEESLFDNVEQQQAPSPQNIIIELDNPQPQQAIAVEQQKKVVKLEDLMQLQQGKKKNLLFLFDDFQEQAD